MTQAGGVVEETGLSTIPLSVFIGLLRVSLQQGDKRMAVISESRGLDYR